MSTADDTLGLTPLERALGTPIGVDRDVAELRPSGEPPRAALERAVRRGLQRPPCVVSFSGGRDSSAVLAVAAGVARREGLPLPVPVSLVFPGADRTDERQWQELVVRHLDLPEWVTVTLDDELDFVGPVAQRLLRRHGLLWPPNTHFHVPVLDHAAGGSLLTGIDGDGVLGSWQWVRAASVMARRVRPRPRDVARVGLALAPPPVRRLAYRLRGGPSELPWLQPAARAEVDRRWCRDAADEPRRWDERTVWFARRRTLRLTVRGLALVAGDVGAAAEHPLADPGFLAALAGAGGPSGYGDRTAIMTALFADDLPAVVLSRRTKAVMNQPFWHRHARSFAAAWGGDGVDRDLVDVDGLRSSWEPPADVRTGTLLQSIWLATDGRR